MQEMPTGSDRIDRVGEHILGPCLRAGCLLLGRMRRSLQLLEVPRYTSWYTNSLVPAGKQTLSRAKGQRTLALLPKSDELLH